jgi:protoheme IX farnesyltransferase
VAAIAPWPLGLTHAIYGWVAMLATAWFALLAARITFRTTGQDDAMRPEKRLFAYSIAYLFILFGAVVVDRWLA